MVQLVKKQEERTAASMGYNPYEARMVGNTVSTGSALYCSSFERLETVTLFQFITSDVLAVKIITDIFIFATRMSIYCHLSKRLVIGNYMLCTRYRRPFRIW